MKTEVRNGLLITLLLGIYFIALDIMGLSDIPYLRFGNALIVLFGINRTLRHNLEIGRDRYFDQFKSALSTSTYGILFSMVGLVLYVGLIVGEAHLQELSSPLFIRGESLGVVQYSISLLFEGLASGVLLSYISMQYYKNAKSLDLNS